MSAISGEPSVEIACAVLECGTIAQWMCAARVFRLSIHVVSEILSLSLGVHRSGQVGSYQRAIVVVPAEDGYLQVGE